MTCSEAEMSSMTAMQPRQPRRSKKLWLHVRVLITFNCVCGLFTLYREYEKPWKLKVGFLYKSSLLLFHKAADVDLLHMMTYCFDPWHADRSLKSLSSLKRCLQLQVLLSIMPTSPAGSSTFTDLSRQKTKAWDSFFQGSGVMAQWGNKGYHHHQHMHLHLI